MLAQIAQDASKNRSHPVRSKQLYVLASLEIDQMKHKLLGQGGGQTTMSTQQTLASLMEHDSATSNLSDMGMDDPWKGAEAFHFHLLCQRQLYTKQWDLAMRTAIRLTFYDMYLDPKDVYSLLALSAFFCKHFARCSKAMGRLESLEGISEEEAKKYKNLSLNIFTMNKPKDPKLKYLPCSSSTCDAQISELESGCDSCGKLNAICIITGAPINNAPAHQCRVCKRRMLQSEIKRFVNCPLCHNVLR